MRTDNGEVDISLAVSGLSAIYQIYNVAFSSQLKEKFTFLKAFSWKLETPSIAVQIVANAMDLCIFL